MNKPSSESPRGQPIDKSPSYPESAYPQGMRRRGFFSDLAWCPMVLVIFILSLMMPSEISFHIGTMRLTPYKVVLLVMFFPSLIRLLRGRVAQFNLADLLMCFHLLWTFIVLEYHHGSSISIETGGLRILELGGAYLLARAYIIDEKSFRGVFSFLIFIICILAPITFLESVTGKHFIKDIASAISGGGFHSNINPRFGFHRAYGPFDHPILYGVFSASLFGVAWFLFPPDKTANNMKRYLRQGAIILAALSSVSSGAVAALTTQIILLLWERMTRGRKGRWKLLTLWIVIVYVIVDIISNRSAIKVFLTYLSFSAATAYNRIIIFNYGIQDVWSNPVFGIGFNLWTRPSWMHSTSMDNFWLLQAVTFGIPGFLSLAVVVLLLLGRHWKDLNPAYRTLRMGWTISMVGVVLTACTVHFWNNSFVYFGFLIGAGAWFQSNIARHRPSPEEHRTFE